MELELKVLRIYNLFYCLNWNCRNKSLMQFLYVNSWIIYHSISLPLLSVGKVVKWISGDERLPNHARASPSSGSTISTYIYWMNLEFNVLFSLFQFQVSNHSDAVNKGKSSENWLLNKIANLHFYGFKLSAIIFFRCCCYCLTVFRKCDWAVS